jgi:SPP1 family phage portal protein
MKTEKTKLITEEILEFINTYVSTEVPKLDTLWEYYLGHNCKILKRTKSDANNPDNRIAVPYGRKIITTYSGYAFRPKYITYKPVETEDDQEEKVIDPNTGMPIENPVKENKYFEKINENFKLNKEWIKTNRAGRNTAIFGVAYELVYIDTDTALNERGEITNKNYPRFVSIDPREMIVLYDFSIEPKKKIAIRFYKTEGGNGRVEVYYNDHYEKYIWIKDDTGEILKKDGEDIANYFGQIPVVAYYFGDEMNGLIEPVISLIDAYDVLVSDSMNEFDRFAFAYLIMKKFGLTDQTKKQSGEMVEKAAQVLKKKRIFEHLPEGADISFLTKDIPDGFIKFMTVLLREQIHIQSHVPDFTSDKMAGASGIAIQRLLFDFENVVSSAEADFDLGLIERMELITIIYRITEKLEGDPDEIVITHKRNMPLNLLEFAQTAVQMKSAGFSRFLIADIMPDDIVPDVNKELARQDEDNAALMVNDLESMNFDDTESDAEEDVNMDEE